MKSLSLGIIFLIFSSVSVFANDICICEIGRYPQEQQGFFKAGCNIWLGGQKCSKSKIVESGYDYRNELNENDSDQLKYKIGYVGHWSGSSETINHIETSIYPLIKNGNSVYYDNTACSGQSNAENVQKYLNSLKLNPGQEITVKGNQAISIGKWDVVLANSANFWAITSSKFNAPKYPACKDFKNSSCMHWVQQGDSGLCSEKNGSVKRLFCKELKSVNSENPYGTMTPSFGWAE